MNFSEDSFNMQLPACRLCLNTNGNKSHPAREMMFGTRDEFIYLECASCGCLQLFDPPARMEKYYPQDYYSFVSKSEGWADTFRPRSILRRIRDRVYLAPWPALIRGVGHFAAASPQFRAFAATKPIYTSRILDVGCGTGNLLNEVANLGFNQMLGIDPFLRMDIKYRNGLEVRKCDLNSLAGTSWDLIMFHHSFEHVPDPLATLQAVANLLSEGGCCLIRVPIAAWTWLTYGVNWVELDAPRHYFLHTERSLGLIAGRAGLEVKKIVYDSDEFELWGSELYKQGIPLNALKKGDLEIYFSAKDLQRFKKTARQLNETGQGGRAAFYLTRSFSYTM